MVSVFFCGSADHRDLTVLTHAYPTRRPSDLSRLTMKYPAFWLVGPKASGEVLSVAYAGEGQHQDTGSKMVHAAPETTSKIVSKSISKEDRKSTRLNSSH